MSETKRRISSRDRVLQALQVAGSLGATNSELVTICFRYGARIFELRNLGHWIDTIPVGNGVFRFVLVPDKPIEAKQLPLIEGMCSHA